MPQRKIEGGIKVGMVPVATGTGEEGTSTITRLPAAGAEPVNQTIDKVKAIQYNQTMNKDIDTKIKELYGEGLSTAQIAREFDLSVSAVRNSLHRSGIELRERLEALRAAKKGERGKWRKDTKGYDVKEMYINGRSIPAISKITGLSRAGVRHRLLVEGCILRDRITAMAAGKRGLAVPRRRGINHPSWKGGRIIDARGYIRLYSPEHPRATNGYVFEHILVWEQAHQQELPKGYIVHHLNGLTSDNRIENLVALPSRRHYFVLQEKASRIQELEKRCEQLEERLHIS